MDILQPGRCIKLDEKKVKSGAVNDENLTKSNGRVVLVGFWGGIIWGIFGFFAYYLNFTKVGPGLILAPWALGAWKKGLYGQLIGILTIALISIVIAFLYKWTLGKIRFMWIAVGFGLALWVIVFYVFQPWIPGLLPVLKIGKDTISTTLSLYILYGLFIGYSISYNVQTKQQPDYSNE
jgi:hypothetical protein